jgi:hypothetical protein
VFGGEGADAILQTLMSQPAYLPIEISIEISMEISTEISTEISIEISIEKSTFFRAAWQQGGADRQCCRLQLLQALAAKQQVVLRDVNNTTDR